MISFDERFRVEARNPAAALRILKPQVLEEIVLASQRIDHPISMSFAQEKALFTQVIQLRRGMPVEELTQAAGQMDALAARISAVAESYPQLRSSEVFAQLQGGIVAAEEDLQAARRAYNGQVGAFNAALLRQYSHPRGRVQPGRGGRPGGVPCGVRGHGGRRLQRGGNGHGPAGADGPGLQPG